MANVFVSVNGNGAYFDKEHLAQNGIDTYWYSNNLIELRSSYHSAVIEAGDLITLSIDDVKIDGEKATDWLNQNSSSIFHSNDDYEEEVFLSPKLY